MTQNNSNQTPDPSASSQAAPGLARRITGIAALFACALVVDPARIVPMATSLNQIDASIALHALVIPALAAIGLWLVLPSTMVLAICVLMLSAAHAQPGAEDLFSGYLYPLLAATAALVLIKNLFFTKRKAT